MAEDADVGQPVALPSSIDWNITNYKLSDGSFLFVLTTEHIVLRLHMTAEQVRKLAANLYQASTGIVVPNNDNGHSE